MSLFSDLNIATSALRANQYAISVTGHNVANADTEGYRRQEVVFAANPPTVSGTLQLGTGVQIQTVKRAQTDYIDRQLRAVNHQSGLWDTKNQALSQLESTLNEPSDSGISTMLDRFWNSWQALAASPESTSARSTVVDAGTSLADSIKNLYQSMKSMQSETDTVISQKVDDINNLTKQIAALNKQIASAGTDQANDLLDSEDLLIDKLSKMTNISVHGTAGSSMIISVGGKALVQGGEVNKLEVNKDLSGSPVIVLASDGSQLLSIGGELEGLLSVRNDLLQNNMDKLDDLTKAIVAQVNAEHSKGTGSNGRVGNFFTDGSDAETISVQADLAQTPAGVAASGTGASGDNSVANAISNLKSSKLIDNQTVGDAYSAFVSGIASQTSQASTMSNTFSLSVSQMSTQRDSVAGVSIDEELSNMIKFQQSYSAAARVFSVIDEMLDVTINRMGAGR